MTVSLRSLLWLAALAAASLAPASALRAEGAVGLAESLRGGVGGSLNLAALPELGLSWRLDAGGRDGLLLKANAQGVRLKVGIAPADRAGEWRWRVLEGAVGVDALWPVLKTALGARAGDWRVGGLAVLSGGGRWTPAGGLAGSVRLELREAWASSAELAVEMGGIEADFYSDDPAVGVLPPGQSLRIARLTAGTVTAERLELRFGLNAARILELGSAEMDVLGGKARLKPLAIPLNSTRAVAGAEVDGVALGELAKLMPDAVSAARGKLSGQVQLLWDAESGLRINDGGLAIVRSDDAVLRLVPMPGFLTGNLPPRFAFLPAWLGPLARWTAPKNPAFAPLQAIEMGRSDLRIETLAVKFYPETDGGERTATVRLTARPEGADLIEQVSIEVNLAGALARVLELGMDKRVKLRPSGE